MRQSAGRHTEVTYSLFDFCGENKRFEHTCTQALFSGCHLQQQATWGGVWSEPTQKLHTIKILIFYAKICAQIETVKEKYEYVKIAITSIRRSLFPGWHDL